MSKKTAIKKLREIQKKLPNDERLHFYKMELRAAAEKYFTKESDEYHEVEWLTQYKLRIPWGPDELKADVIEENRECIDNLIQTLINTLKIKGMPQKVNWLKRIPDAWLTTIVFVAIPGVFWLGVMVNDKLTIKKEYELQRTIDSLNNVLTATSRPAFGISDPITKDSVNADNK